MHWIPPNSAQRSLINTKREAAPGMTIEQTKDLRDKLKAYRRVSARSGDRKCEKCGAGPLYGERVRIQVMDDTSSIYDPYNLKLYCPSCSRKAGRLTAADQTGFTVKQMMVIEREGRRCVYCLRGPLYGEHAEIVSRVSNADVNDPNDWSCSCKTCKNERGSLSHDEYGRRCAENAADLATYLRDTFTD